VNTPSGSAPKERPTLPPDDPRHGTPNGYNNLGCRCQRCRDAWAAYCRALYAARKRPAGHERKEAPVVVTDTEPDLLRKAMADALQRALRNALIDLWEQAEREGNEAMERAVKDTLADLGLPWVRPR
jgi:hypothetical protein